jgi:hypothetical protein
MISAFLAPNFTEYGFGLARAPQDLLEALQKGIHDGLDTAVPEHNVPVIFGQPPLMVHRPDLVTKVLHDMQSYAEAWAGFPLTPFQAYGFRVYRQGNQLMMHTDRSQTHIISFILHIDSSDDAEPWPILIEDFHGRTWEVILTPGDVLFYESSKCNHGRPIPFKGSWYTSVFVHYYPKTGWSHIDHDLEGHYAIPPIWNADPVRPRTVEQIEMEGMSFREPQCPHDWCATQSTFKWSGPGQEGYWFKPGGEKVPLILPVVVGERTDADEL